MKVLMQIDADTVDVSTEMVQSIEVVELGPAEIALTVLSLLLIGAFLVSFSKWFGWLIRGRRPFGPKAFVPVRERHQPFWSVLYFVVFMGGLLFSASVLQLTFLAMGWIERPSPDAEAASGLSVPQLGLSSLGMLSATVITIGLLLIHRSDAIRRLGLIPQRGDISLGLRSAVMILPPTMLIMGLVSVLQEYSHPVLDALKPADGDAGPDFAVFGLLFITTALITPVVEEFWIRGLLQGGLQRLADWRLPMVQSAIATKETESTVRAGERNDVDGNPYQPPVSLPETQIEFHSEESEHIVEVSPDQDPSDWTPRAIWPVFAASLVFALMHWGQGLAPIPLFFLSLGLGYLYRQTGSLVPPIVVHFVLNGLTMVMTLIEMSRAS